MKRPLIPRLAPAGLLLLTGFLAASALLTGASPKAHAVPLPQASSGKPTVRWVFHESDLLSCRTAAYALRHLRSRFGGQVEVVAVGVGVNEQVVRSFLRAQRLEVPFASVSEAAYRRQYRTIPAAGLYVTLNDRVVQAFPAGPSHRYPDVDLLSRSVGALIPLLEPSPAIPTPRRQS